MITIVDKGHKRCWSCNCFFTFGKEDIKVEEGKQVILKKTKTTYIECPQCGGKVILYED